jgi:hypothetical protein
MTVAACIAKLARQDDTAFEGAHLFALRTLRTGFIGFGSPPTVAKDTLIYEKNGLFMGSKDIIIVKLIVFLYANLNIKSTTLIYEKYINLAVLKYPRFQAPKFSTANLCNSSKFGKNISISNLHLLFIFPAQHLFYNPYILYFV